MINFQGTLPCLPRHKSSIKVMHMLIQPVRCTLIFQKKITFTSPADFESRQSFVRRSHQPFHYPVYKYTNYVFLPYYGTMNSPSVVSKIWRTSLRTGPLEISLQQITSMASVMAQRYRAISVIFRDFALLTCTLLPVHQKKIPVTGESRISDLASSVTPASTGLGVTGFIAMGASVLVLITDLYTDRVHALPLLRHCLTYFQCRDLGTRELTSFQPKKDQRIFRNTSRGAEYL